MVIENIHLLLGEFTLLYKSIRDKSDWVDYYHSSIHKIDEYFTFAISLRDKVFLIDLNFDIEINKNYHNIILKEITSTQHDIKIDLNDIKLKNSLSYIIESIL